MQHEMKKRINQYRKTVNGKTTIKSFTCPFFLKADFVTIEKLIIFHIPLYITSCCKRNYINVNYITQFLSIALCQLVQKSLQSLFIIKSCYNAIALIN